jgi:undecaprenyl-diphosphatase
VSDREARVFRRFNAASDRLEAPLWAVMQAGSLGAVFAVAGAKWAAHRQREAIIVLALGAAVWLGVKLVKPLIGRGRPADHLDGVTVRGQPQSGLGYPSGHAAVSTTLVLSATSPGPMRLIGLSIAAVAGSSRMYVGAHLPLDVAGGYAAGALVGSVGGRLVRSGRRAARPPANRGQRSRQAPRWRPGR